MTLFCFEAPCINFIIYLLTIVKQLCVCHLCIKRLLTYLLTSLSVYREAVCCQWHWCYWPAMITWFSTWAPPCWACSSAVSHRRRYHWPRATSTSPVRHYVVDTWCRINLRHRCHPINPIPSLFKWSDVYGHRRWILKICTASPTLQYLPFTPSSPLFFPIIPTSFSATARKPEGCA